MEAPLVCTIHGANLIIHIMSLYPFGPLAIPNENILRCPRGQRTNLNNVARTINGNRYFIYTTGIFRIEEDIKKDASYTSDGHAVHIMRDKIGKVWDMVPLKQFFHPSNFGDNTIHARTNRIGCLTLAFSGAQKRAEMIRHPCILGDPQTKGDKIRSDCLTPAFSGAQKRAEMLRHPAFLGSPNKRGTNSQLAASALPRGSPTKETQ